MPLVNPRPLGISNAVPIKIGGNPSAGVGLLASAFDHGHALVETAGPTNMGMGGILDGETVRRLGALFVGRAFEVFRLSDLVATTSSNALSDVNTGLNFTLKTGFHVFLYAVPYDTAATTTGIRLAVNFSGSIADIRATLLAATSATAMFSTSVSTNNTAMGSAGVGPGSSTVLAIIAGAVNATSAGTLALRYASGVNTSAVTVRQGTWGCVIQSPV